MLANCFNWICPVCKQSLTLNNATWECENQHRFDKAKEGYVNLLLAQHKKSKEPGDSKDMVLARHAFLTSGAYAPLANALSQLCTEHISKLPLLDDNKFTLLDVGCSEGYYSSRIQSSVQNHLSRAKSDELSRETVDDVFQVCGIDVSKSAVQKSAKRNRGNSYAVASSYNIPLADKTVDIALQVFAPSSIEEVARVVKSGGMWISVEPNQSHLKELKSFVYDKALLHQIKMARTPGFSLGDQTSICFPVSLNSPEARLNLLKMTPYYWKISEQNKQKLTEQLAQVTADFTVNIYYKDASAQEQV